MSTTSTTNPALAPMFTFIKLTSGRRMHALRQMRGRALDLGEPGITTHLDDAIEHERHVQGLNRRWKGRRRGSKYTATLTSVDQQLGSTVSALRDMVFVYIKGARSDDDRRIRAERIMQELFPDGVYGITSLPYVEKLAAVDMLLDLLAGPLLADADALHLDHLIERLQELTTSYRELLSQTDKLRFSEVKAARERGHTFMLEAVAMTLGRYYKAQDPDHEHKRGMLLQPIAAQDLAMRQYLRNRRRGAPVDDERADEIANEIADREVSEVADQAVSEVADRAVSEIADQAVDDAIDEVADREDASPRDVNANGPAKPQPERGGIREVRPVSDVGHWPPAQRSGLFVSDAARKQGLTTG